MEKIYDRNFIYSFLHPFVNLAVFTSYRQRQVIGKSRIPEDGAVIIAPNHTNALMDALVILSSFNDGTIFGTRADIFRKPLLAKIFFNLRMVPMTRVRDGLRNVAKNHEISESVYEALAHGMRFCIFPEGTHRPAHSLLHVGKGTIRMALEANEAMGGKKPVYIVPTGIEYGDYFRFRSSVLINFGRAINVTDFVNRHPELTDIQAINPLREQLEKSMSELISYAPDDEFMEDKWTLATLLTNPWRALYSSMQDRRAVLEKIEQSLVSEAEKTEALLYEVREFNKERIGAKVSRFSFKSKHLACRSIFKAAASLLALPVYIFCAIAALPLLAASMYFVHKSKDRAFLNTARFGVKLGGGILMTGVWAALCFCLLHPWYIALGTFILCLLSYDFVMTYNEFVRIAISDFRLLFNRKLRDRYRELIGKSKEIIQ